MNDKFFITQNSYEIGNRQQFIDKTPIEIATSEFGLHDFSIIKNPSGLHSHQCFCIHIIMKGKGVYVCTNKKIACKKGDVIVSSPNIPVQFIPDPKDPWTYFWILFSGKDAKNLINQTGFSIEKPVYSLKDFNPYKEIINKTVNPTNDFSLKTRTLGSILEIFSLLAEERSLVDSSKSINELNQIFLDAISIIEKNYANQSFRIKKICHELSISHSSLCKIFKKFANRTMNNYLVDFRLREARVLLDNGERVNVVAYAVGYNDHSHFSREFKQHFGLSPKEYIAYQKVNKK